VKSDEKEEEEEEVMNNEWRKEREKWEMENVFLFAWVSDELRHTWPLLTTCCQKRNLPTVGLSNGRLTPVFRRRSRGNGLQDTDLFYLFCGQKMLHRTNSPHFHLFLSPQNTRNSIQQRSVLCEDASCPFPQVEHFGTC